VAHGEYAEQRDGAEAHRAGDGMVTRSSQSGGVRQRQRTPGGRWWLGGYLQLGWRQGSEWGSML
jgi:hypothetical protein